jgi:hypothetical protein
MRLDLLEEREDIESNISRTLEYFISTRTSWKGELNWENYGEGSREKKEFLVKNRVNLLHPVSCDRKNLLELASQYRFGHSYFQSFVQSLYVRLLNFSLFDAFNTPRKLRVDPWRSEFDSWVIMPGNRKLRVFDFDANVCYVILKDGYDAKYFNNDISIRDKLDLAPRVIRIIPGEKWYEEEIISGLPLNRIASHLSQANAVNKVRGQLQSLYQQSCRSVETLEWIDSVFCKIEAAVASLPVVYSDVDVRLYREVSWQLMAQTKQYDYPNITTVLSHGDCQKGNVLVEFNAGDEKVHLIDWEYADRRAAHYDPLVFDLDARSSYGLAERIASRLSDKAGFLEDKLWQQHLDWPTVALFLLEDLLLKLEEQNIPGLRKKSAALAQFACEVTRAIRDFGIRGKD